LSQSTGQVTHVLLTRSRLCPRASSGSSLHLHVLSTPPAFVLSQDQTLREVNCTPAHLRTSAPDTKSCQTSCGTSNTRLVPRDDGILFQPRDLRWRRSGGRTWTRTSDPTESKGAHAVEFSKTVAPCREGVTFERTLPTSPRAQGAGPSSLAPLGGGCAARLESRCRCPAEAKYTHSSEPYVVRSSHGRPVKARPTPGSLVPQGYPGTGTPRNRQLVQFPPL
jgi:hypothetical protein